MNRAMLLLLLTFCAGCYSSKYLPYAGAQQDWPTAQGSFMQTNGPLPIYFGYPPKPYEYVAQISVTTQAQGLDVILIAAREAKSKGAQALIVLDESSRPTGSVGSGFGTGMQNGRVGFGSGFGTSTTTYGGVAKCIAIRFK